MARDGDLGPAARPDFVAPTLPDKTPGNVTSLGCTADPCLELNLPHLKGQSSSLARQSIALAKSPYMEYRLNKCTPQASLLASPVLTQGRRALSDRDVCARQTTSCGQAETTTMRTTVPWIRRESWPQGTGSESSAMAHGKAISVQMRALGAGLPFLVTHAGCLPSRRDDCRNVIRQVGGSLHRRHDQIK